MALKQSLINFTDPLNLGTVIHLIFCNNKFHKIKRKFCIHTDKQTNTNFFCNWYREKISQDNTALITIEYNVGIWMEYDLVEYEQTNTVKVDRKSCYCACCSAHVFHNFFYQIRL